MRQFSFDNVILEHFDEGINVNIVTSYHILQLWNVVEYQVVGYELDCKLTLSESNLMILILTRTRILLLAERLDEELEILLQIKQEESQL
jgi:hypothetical protein